MTTTRSTEIYIWLHGTPVFSLSYSIELPESTGNLGTPTDITGYRPDPRMSLKKGERYKAVGKFIRETDHEGQDIWILNQIMINGTLKYVYIR